MEDIFSIAKRFKDLSEESKVELLRRAESLSEIRKLGLIATINSGCVSGHDFSEWIPVSVEGDYATRGETEACICLSCGCTRNKIDNRISDYKPMTMREAQEKCDEKYSTRRHG